MSLDPPRQDVTTGKAKRIVIVGGGLAGLAAAEALVRQTHLKCEIILLEAKRTTGGRAGSFLDSRSGETIDYCQHVAMGCCTNFLSLMRRCGLIDAFHRYRELTFLYPGHRPSQFAPSRGLPAPFHMAKALWSLRYLSIGQKRRIARAMWKLFRTPSAALKDQTATQWLHSQGQDSLTIRDFWSVVIVSALGELPERTSMAAARKVFVDGFAAAQGAADVWVPSKPLQELFGHDLPKTLEAMSLSIQMGVSVREVCSDPVSVVTSQESLHADHVIVATPWHAAAALMPAQRRSELARIDQLPASAISGLHLWFDTQFTDLPHAVLVGGLAQWLFRQPWSGQPSGPDPQAGDRQSDASHYYQVVISASQQAASMSKDDLVQCVLGELAEVFPAASNARLLRSRVVKDPRAVFSLTPEVESQRPAARTALPWLHLAGDWVATGWPATMEGAIISGRNAANSVLQSEHQPTVVVEDGLQPGWLARRLIVD